MQRLLVITTVFCTLSGALSEPLPQFSGVLAGDMERLTEAQRVQLQDIQTGKVTKSQIEIVLSQFDEDTAWSDGYANLRTVYCKGGGQGHPGAPLCRPLPNVGREGHTFLHHIVDNYDRLAEWTVFSQAGEPTVGYKGHRAGGGHMLQGTSFHDYVLRSGESEDNGAYFVFTGKVKLSTLGHSLRLGYVQADKPLTSSALHQPMCPKSDAADGWQEYWDLGWFKNFLGARCGVDPTQIPRAFQDYWETHLKMPRPESDIVFFTQGARFAASRARIWQRPKSFYQQMLQLVSAEQDPCANYFNEWAWYYMIGLPHQTPCAVSHSDVEAKVTRKLLATDGASAPISVPPPPSCYVSGIKWVPHFTKGRLESKDECMDSCNKQTNCAHFTYREEDGQCTLANARAKARAAFKSTVSGPPSCGESATVLDHSKSKYTILRGEPEDKDPASRNKGTAVNVANKNLQVIVIGCAAGFASLVVLMATLHKFRFRQPEISRLTTSARIPSYERDSQLNSLYANLEINGAE